MAAENPALRAALLYIGALTDAFPLMATALRAEHTHFLFVDQQPLHDARMQLRTEQEIMDELVHVSCGALGPPVRDDAARCWRCTVRGGATLLYFFNPLDSEVATHATLAPLLPDVTTLYVQGFVPCKEVHMLLPRLRTVYVTVWCRGGQPLFCDDDGLHNARPNVNIVEIVESDWDPDEGRWTLRCCEERDFMTSAPENMIRTGRRYHITGAVLPSDCGPPPYVFIHDYESDEDDD